MSVPTAALRKARENAGINQGEMAKRLGVSSNSVISRLEKTEVTDRSMAERYLKAIGTEDSLAMLDFYSRDWKVSKRPDFRHPNRDVLWAAEQALQDLEAFEAADEFDQLLTAPLIFTRETLLATADYVGRIDHALAWIGAVGIGKTTALSHLTNLVYPDSAGRPRAIFPTSGGRTTTSEVVVRAAPAFSVTVEPKGEDEVRLLVREFVDAVADGKGGISTELERAIRSMADLPKRKDSSDPKALLDPVKELLDGASGAREDVVHAIVTRMRLEQRTETQMFMSENNTSGLQWLSSVVTDINFGRHPRVSIPDRVIVFLPKSAIRKSPYDLTIIDTKGIHGTTDRPDLQALTADSRALSILCCAFNDAPGQEPLSILKGLKEMGSDALDRQRVALLVLPRGDEAIRVIDDLGEPVESVEEGYAYRSRQIQDSLKAANLPPVPVIFFNVADEGAGVVWQEISQQVDQIRQRQLERLERFTGLAAELRTNADAHRIQQARVTLAKEAIAIANDYEVIPGSVSVAQKRLLQELKASHPSSIAAAALRNGSWYNLDVHHMVGTGVRADANLRTSELVARIKGRLDGLQNQFASTPEAVALVETLAEDLSDWHQEFLVRAQSIGRNTFKPYLDNDVEFWADLRKRYGQGAGYRDDIVAKVDKWFEGSALNPARSKVDARLADAWKELMLSKLVEITTLEEEAAG
ncbi:XRE family transcriptional regulator [Oleomonas cavernae]|uniref:XRE family transcriptional regulator n=1 Tax=Oleomonas cavernae TaxID=2320859 RepID=A0A418WF49_9PROT|nr:helix-turn-helix transcriptional regulator [Oleomonas cavernae]RJF88637.1 XRE family transcriptional regulator [Oleomonas cavernae]